MSTNAEILGIPNMEYGSKIKMDSKEFTKVCMDLYPLYPESMLIIVDRG